MRLDTPAFDLILLKVVEGFVFFLVFFFVPPSRPAWSP
jgi:hypothetical protein